MATPRLLALLGPMLAAIGLRLHQARLDAGLVSCTGCGDFATSLADLCDDCDNDMRADCQARKEDDMPKSSTTHTLYRVEIHDAGTGQLLRVISQRWSLRKGSMRAPHLSRSRFCWFTMDNPVAYCYADIGAGGNPGRVYPPGWHPSEDAAVEAYYQQQHAEGWHGMTRGAFMRIEIGRALLVLFGLGLTVAGFCIAHSFFLACLLITTGVFLCLEDTIHFRNRRGGKT